MTVHVGLVNVSLGEEVGGGGVSFFSLPPFSI